MSDKYIFTCWDCGRQVEWDGHSAKEKCPDCGGAEIKVMYPGLTVDTFNEMLEDSKGATGLWKYFDVLPVKNKESIVSYGEGGVSVQRWHFLEGIAREVCGLECTVYAHRQDLNPATGSFKDLAGSLVATAMNEREIREYVVASTGNIASAFAAYLSRSGSLLYAFVPSDATFHKEADISCFGQVVYRVNGDYTQTKAISNAFAAAGGLTVAGGTFDPFRIEAKKTMSFEWLRQLDEFPTVYIQALSGGTGPAGVAKGCSELMSAGLVEKMPRLILVQSDRCDPMARAWSSSVKNDFPAGWETSYEVIDNPVTEIPTLATGNPSGYPRLAPQVKKSGGSILSLPEELSLDVGCLVAHTQGVRLGSAAAMGVGGFFAALKNRLIKNGDRIVVNAGEGIQRDPGFLEKFIQPAPRINSAEECNRSKERQEPVESLSKLRKYITDKSEEEAINE